MGVGRVLLLWCLLSAVREHATRQSGGEKDKERWKRTRQEQTCEERKPRNKGDKTEETGKETRGRMEERTQNDSNDNKLLVEDGDVTKQEDETNMRIFI